MNIPRFSIRHLFLFITITGPALGIMLSNRRGGAVLGFGYAFLSWLVWFCVRRLFVRWKEYSLFSRAYALFTATATLFLLVSWLVFIAAEPSLIRSRKAASLQRELNRNVRFAEIRIEAVEIKRRILWVTGKVELVEDHEELKQIVAMRKWSEFDGVLWELHIAETETKIDEFDADIIQQ